MAYAIFTVVAIGGDFTDEGDYSTPVMLSYLLENGDFVQCLASSATGINAVVSSTAI